MNEEQVGRLDNLHDRGIKNEVPDLKVVGPDEIRDIEPNCVVNMTSYGCHSCVALDQIIVAFVINNPIHAINPIRSA